MVFQVMLAVLAMAALQDVHATRLKVSGLVENSDVDSDDLTKLDQQHVTQLESNAAPGVDSSVRSGLHALHDRGKGLEPVNLSNNQDDTSHQDDSEAGDVRDDVEVDDAKEDDSEENDDSEVDEATTTTTMEATTPDDVGSNDRDNDLDNDGSNDGSNDNEMTDETITAAVVTTPTRNITGLRFPVQAHLVKCHPKTFWLFYAGGAYGLLGGCCLAAVFGFLCSPRGDPPDIPRVGDQTPGRDPQDNPQWGISMEILAHPSAGQIGSIPEAVPLWTCRRVLAVVIPVVICPWFGCLAGYHFGSQKESVVYFSCGLGTHPPSDGNDCNSEVITSRKCITIPDWCQNINSTVDAAALNETRTVSCTGELMGNDVTCGPDGNFTPVPQCVTMLVTAGKVQLDDNKAVTCGIWPSDSHYGCNESSAWQQLSASSDHKVCTGLCSQAVAGNGYAPLCCFASASAGCYMQLGASVNSDKSSDGYGQAIMCKGYTCSCPNGVAQKAPDCTEHEATQCASCNPGYHGDTCEAWGCTTASDTGCKTCVGQAQRISDTTCATCNDGYHEVEGTCQAWGCTTASDTGCKTCVGQAQRISDTTCATCNDGYHEVEGTCQAWNCNTGIGTACTSCVSLPFRTIDDHCHTCNNGYHLVDRSCQAWGCLTADSGAGCKSCVLQEKRTGEANCATCNDGYHEDTETCQANRCDCPNGVARTVPDCTVDQATECASCNPGYHGDTCEANRCSCPNGVARIVPDCIVDQALECASCNPGYHGDTCEAWGCTTGSGIGCLACVQQPYRTNNAHCASCNDGHGVVGTSCQACASGVSAPCPDGYQTLPGNCCEAWGCTTGPGTECLACVKQPYRTSHASCADCNEGFHLIDMTCQACKSGKTAPCPSGYRQLDDGCCEANRCRCPNGVARTERTAPACTRDGATQCTTCKPGYHGITCQAFSCLTDLFGAGCKTCVAQALRTSDTTCASCNAPYVKFNGECMEASKAESLYEELKGNNQQGMTELKQEMDRMKEELRREAEAEAARLKKENEEQLEKAKEEERKKAAHPACKGHSTCKCAAFYDLLIKQCMKEDDAHEEGSEERETECASKIQFLWDKEVSNRSMEKVWRRWSYDFFLKPFSHKDSAETPQGLFAGFWAGYSWTLGTRQVFDKLIDSKLKPGAFGTLAKVEFHLEDIEHRTHRIGAAMRHLKWDRGCHQSGHDSNLWLSLSKAYAEGTSAEAQEFVEVQKSSGNVLKAMGGTLWNMLPGTGGNEETTTTTTSEPSSVEVPAPPVVVFVNKPIKALPKTFLFEHELALMQNFSKIILVDYKNSCASKLTDMVTEAAPKKFSEKDSIVCLKGNNEKDMGELFADAKHAVQLAEDLELLEKDIVPGITWEVKGDAPLYSEKSEQVADFDECQTKCNNWKECKFLTYHPRRTKQGQCVMFDRDLAVDYKRTQQTIISGRKQNPKKKKENVKEEKTDSEASQHPGQECWKKWDCRKEGAAPCTPCGGTDWFCCDADKTYKAENICHDATHYKKDNKKKEHRCARLEVVTPFKGYLKKESDSGYKWNFRYVELDGGKLNWWKPENIEKGKEHERKKEHSKTLNLKGMDAQVKEKAQFFIVDGDENHKFDATTDRKHKPAHSAKDWVAHLKKHIAYANINSISASSDALAAEKEAEGWGDLELD